MGRAPKPKKKKGVDQPRKPKVKSFSVYHDMKAKLMLQGVTPEDYERLGKMGITKRELVNVVVNDCRREYMRPLFQKGLRYKELNRLLLKGVPEREIAYIHDANTDKKKASLFSKVRSGEVRILMGSTEKMGAGTNVQTKLIALHHLDVPWKPADIEQQEGRILRRGNDNKEVDIYRYITQGTFDVYSWQILERKQKFISQIMTSKNPARSCEDIDEAVLSYAEVKALATGDPRIKEKMDLDVEIAKLRTLKSDHDAQVYQFQDDLAKRIPRQMQEDKTALKRLEAADKVLQAHPVNADRFSMEIGGKVYTERKAAGAAIVEMCLADDRPEGLIGSYRGFEMRLTFDADAKQYRVELKNSVVLAVNVSEDAVGTVTRMNNALEQIPESIQQRKESIAGLHQQMETMREEVQKPFEQQAELKRKEERLTTLLQELADVQKEQGAKRKLRQGARDSAPAPGLSSGQSISSFVQNFKPAPAASPAARQREPERER